MLFSIVLPAVLLIVMFSLGLSLAPADFSRVFREPRGFWTGAFNQILMAPLVAFLAATVFDLPPALAVGMMIVGLCPGGAISNVASHLGKGNVPLSVTLTATFSLLSIVSLPPLVALSVYYFIGLDSPPVKVASLSIEMFVLTAVPVFLGVAVRQAMPQRAGAIQAWMGRTTVFLFVFVLVAALVSNWSLFVDNFAALAPDLIVMNALLLGIGLLTSRIAGLDARSATSVAIGTAVHNGTIGIAVGVMVAGTTSGLPPTTLPTAIYSITVWFLTIPFIFWRRQVASKEPQTALV